MPSTYIWFVPLGRVPSAVLGRVTCNLRATRMSERRVNSLKFGNPFFAPTTSGMPLVFRASQGWSVFARLSFV